MNSREHLEDDIKRIARVLRSLGFGVWAVAAFVMIYGIPVAFGPLKDHGIPGEVAWMPSLAADAAMSVAIIAGPVLASYGVRAGWIGILRWSAAFTTWALQTAGSWLADGGPDWAGVGLHSLPPLLLFVVGEGAAYFVRKMSGVLEVKRRDLAAAEQKDADRRAHLAEVEADLRAFKAEIANLTSERAGHLQQIDSLREEMSSTVTRLTAAEASVGDLRSELADTSGRLTEATSTAGNRASEVADLNTRIAELEGALNTARDDAQRVKREHSEALRKARAEAQIPNLSDRRGGKGGGANLKPANRARFSDEEAVQRLLEVPSDPAKGLPSGDVREWSQQAIVDTLSVGWQRAPRLLEAVTEAQRNRNAEDSSGDRAVNQ